MRENLTESEMRGPIHFEVFIRRLSPEEAQKLREIFEQIAGVSRVRRNPGSPQCHSDTFLITVESSRLQYFHQIYEEVQNRAFSYQYSGQ